jgi:hypothetical protein
VHVDDPGHQVQAAAIDDLGCGGLNSPDLGNPSLRNAHIALESRLPSAVDDDCAAKQDVEHAPTIRHEVSRRHDLAAAALAAARAVPGVREIEALFEWD